MTTADLIKRCEEAGADQEGTLVQEALDLARDRGWIARDTWDQGMHMLEAGAYESAALLLVPEGWQWEMASYSRYDDQPRAALWRNLNSEEFDETRALGWIAIAVATPALAILAASLRALEAQEE